MLNFSQQSNRTAMCRSVSGNISGNKALPSIVEESAKKALLSTDQHILVAFIPNETLLCRDVGPNETLLSMDLILLATTDVFGNETLLSIVDESAKQALLSTKQHILSLLLPNKTLLSIDVNPNETLRSIVGGV
eukprot:9002107-Pyramimonas_sp.AAC.1